MKTIWKCILLSGGLILSANRADAYGYYTYTVQYKIAAPIYLVTVKEAERSDTFDTDTGGAIYKQAFLPKSVAKIDQDLAVPFISYSGEKKDSKPTIMAAGSVFVEADYEGKKVYCAALKQASASMFGTVQVPLGICLGDPDSSGKFSEIYYFRGDANFPIRQAYEVFQVEPGSEAVTKGDIDVAYENIPVDESFASQIEIVYHKPGLFSKDPTWAPIINISPRLVPEQYAGDVVAVVNFGVSTRSPITSAYWLYESYTPNDGTSLTFGNTIRVDFAKTSDGAWKLSWNRFMPAGDYYLRSMTTSGVFGFASAVRHYVTTPAPVHYPQDKPSNLTNFAPQVPAALPKSPLTPEQ